MKDRFCHIVRFQGDNCSKCMSGRLQPAIDFLVRGQRVRLMGHGEAEPFLESLKKYCLC